MKRLASIPTVFALVAMVAACTDMTAPEVTPPEFIHSPAIGQCPPGEFFFGVFLLHPRPPATPAQAKADVNGDGFVCRRNIGRGRGEFIFTDNVVPNKVELPFP